jgi:Ran GTPase-activating protein (RanGAP) involved in mRNA processing and transport
MASVEYLIKQYVSADRKKLNLSNFNLGDKGAIMLAKSKELSRLERLGLPNNNIGDEGAAALATSPLLKNLIELDLYGNVIGDDGVKALFNSPYLTKLKKLNLYGNLIEDEGALVIAGSPNLLPHLSYLYLTANRIRKEGIDALKKAQTRTRLCNLHVDEIEEFVYADDEADVEAPVKEDDE